MVVGTMNLLNLLMERLRPLVGSFGWDYCVLWTISDDQRLIEWTDCCCSGAENNRNGGEDYHFPVSPNLCRDALFQHTRTEACELLAQLPSSMPLDSGVYMDILISSQPRWLNISNNDEMLGTKVLIPLAGVLVELYSTKQVPEDQGILNFITAQCSIPIKPDSLLPLNNMDANYAITVNPADELHPKPYFTEVMNHNDLFQPPNSESLAEAHMNLNLPYDITHDKIQLCSSQGNILENYNYKPDNRTDNDVILEVLGNPCGSSKKMRLLSADNGIQDMDAPENAMRIVDNIHMEFGELSMNKEQQGNDNNPMKPDTGRSESISDCSDQNEDDDTCRNGKRSQSKNLHAERKRRKKLNDRLYALRALVPNISKLDRASILGDAIEFIRDLQRQAKELQDELEEHSDVEDGKNSELDDNQNNAIPEVLSPNGHNAGFAIASDKGTIGHQLTKTCCNTTKKRNNDTENSGSKQQQMEPQVEVSPIDGNEFFIKVFGEHRSGAFVRLMEALDALGLEVVNANVTSFLSLVSNVFIVEKKDCDMLEVDQVKDSLLEVTRNPSVAWTGMSKTSEAGSSKDCTQHHFHLSQNHHFNSQNHHLPC